MPEGHSIRHLANVFEERLVGERVALSSPQGRFATEAAVLDGKTLRAARAHGKHLFLEFEPDQHVHIHLGLYGWLYVEHAAAAEDPKPSTRLRISTDLYVADLVGPTACELLTHDQTQAKIAKLGPDPIHEDSDSEEAWRKITKSSRSIASLLMNQAVVAGIGNVYRAELLFMTKTNPYLTGRQVSKEKFNEIWKLASRLLRDGSRDGKIRTVAREHLANDEVSWHGCSQFSYVYKRIGNPCRVCGTPVAHAEVDARVLYWCPTCQV